MFELDYYNCMLKIMMEFGLHKDLRAFCRFTFSLRIMFKLLTFNLVWLLLFFNELWETNVISFVPAIQSQQFGQKITNVFAVCFGEKRIWRFF